MLLSCFCLVSIIPILLFISLFALWPMHFIVFHPKNIPQNCRLDIWPFNGPVDVLDQLCSAVWTADLDSLDAAQHRGIAVGVEEGTEEKIWTLLDSVCLTVCWAFFIRSHASWRQMKSDPIIRIAAEHLECARSGSDGKCQFYRSTPESHKPRVDLSSLSCCLTQRRQDPCSITASHLSNWKKNWSLSTSIMFSRSGVRQCSQARSFQTLKAAAGTVVYASV